MDPTGQFSGGPDPWTPRPATPLGTAFQNFFHLARREDAGTAFLCFTIVCLIVPTWEYTVRERRPTRNIKSASLLDHRHLLFIYLGLFIIPHTDKTEVITTAMWTVECHRDYSQMNLIMTPTRKSLSVSTESALLFGKGVGSPLSLFKRVLHTLHSLN